SSPAYIRLQVTLCLLAWASFLGPLWSVALILLYMVYIRYFHIVTEQRALSTLFIDEFTVYKKQV
ncbi:MAG: protein-S-isoprenylcysteine O-methyltransferase Ste14, partial [Colwellia sp.]